MRTIPAARAGLQSLVGVWLWRGWGCQMGEGVRKERSAPAVMGRFTEGFDRLACTCTVNARCQWLDPGKGMTANDPEPPSSQKLESCHSLANMA